MKRRTYVEGQYSQIQLPDGKNIFFSVLPDRIKVSEMRFLIPKKSFWEFIFPFYIRTSNEAWKSSGEILDLALNEIGDAKNLDEVKSLLDTRVNQALRDYVSSHGEEARDISVDKVGIHAIKKMLNPKELVRVETIVRKYGKVIEETHQQAMEKYPSMHFPISLLPYPKEKIRKALDMAIQQTSDEKMTENLKAVRAMLVSFIDDDLANKKNTELLEAFSKIPNKDSSNS